MRVQKYGGKSLATIHHIKRIAERVAALHQSGESLIVVVSAMGQSTDELIRLAHQVSPRPLRREMDMLLTTGERVSMALMSIALNGFGCPAISFTGSQAGVLTSESHSNAQITDIKPLRVEQALREGKVVVLAGFQGVSPQRKEVTTLGRGGSDTTAVAMAAHFKAEICEILKDVDGICSGDPKLVENTLRYSELPTDLVANMCFWGAKVLHYRSVELAHSLKVPLFVGSAQQNQHGTLLKHEVFMYEEAKVIAVNSHAQVHHYKVESLSLAEAYQNLFSATEALEVPPPQILASVKEVDHCRLMLTGDEVTLTALDQLSQNPNQWGVTSLARPLCSVTLSGYGLTTGTLLNEALAILQKEKVSVEKFLTQNQSLSFFIPPEDRSRTISLLHRHFLGKP